MYPGFMAMSEEEKRARAARRRSDRRVQDWHAQSYGPQVPGGTYRNGYWGVEYAVEAMWSDRAGGWEKAPFLRCRDADGSVREHCTRWDDRPVRGDRVVRQPGGYEGVPLADRYAADRAARRRTRAER
jgi:hypothetical protein